MGFLKRFFSIGSRKSKKRPAVVPYAESLPPLQVPSHDDGAEAAVSRLLRSSSGRCVPQSHPDLTSLPPLPHPIDSVIPLPKSSSTTIASVSARSTYSVVVRSRTVHSRTEFPNAYPLDTLTPKRSLTDSPRRRSKSVPITPRDKSRLLALRQDPSVANLLNHYDDQGHLDSALFSNSPSPLKDGRVRRRRTGSTFRQLLGHPSSAELRNSIEGDISWAERFLGSASFTPYSTETDETISETDGNSSVSSIGPRTPLDTHFNTHSIGDKTAFSIECDTSAANHATFSSLEVELSASTDHAHSQTARSPTRSPMTSQRASQIFGFLGDKKGAQDGPVSRLPQLKTATPNCRRFSAESPTCDTKYSQIPLPRRSNTYMFQPVLPTSQRHLSPASDMSKSPPSPITALFSSPQPGGIAACLPQAVISQHAGQSSRGPRGPRPPSKIPSRHSTGPPPVPCDFDESHSVTERLASMQSVLGEKSSNEDKYIPVAVAQSREMHSQIPKLRTPSGSSSCTTESKHEPVVNSPLRHPIPLEYTVQKDCWPIESPSGIGPHKENNMLSRLPQPITPVRPVVYYPHHLHELPSPASSSELSPVAKQMMSNLRQQRMHARQRERQAGRLGSSQSRSRC